MRSAPGAASDGWAATTSRRSCSGNVRSCVPCLNASPRRGRCGCACADRAAPSPPSRRRTPSGKTPCSGPARYASSGVTRDMSDRNELVVRSVLDDAAAHRSSFPADSTPRKLGTFYATCMDSTAIEAAGATPIRPWLRGIDSVTTRARLVPEIAKLQVLGVNVVFRYSPDVDPHDALHYLTWLYQGGLGLP